MMSKPTKKLYFCNKCSEHVPYESLTKHFNQTPCQGQGQRASESVASVFNSTLLDSFVEKPISLIHGVEVSPIATCRDAPKTAHVIDKGHLQTESDTADNMSQLDGLTNKSSKKVKENSFRRDADKNLCTQQNRAFDINDSLRNASQYDENQSVKSTLEKMVKPFAQSDKSVSAEIRSVKPFRFQRRDRDNNVRNRAKIPTSFELFNVGRTLSDGKPSKKFVGKRSSSVARAPVVPDGHVTCKLCLNVMSLNFYENHLRRKHNGGDEDQSEASAGKASPVSCKLCDALMHPSYIPGHIVRKHLNKGGNLGVLWGNYSDSQINDLLEAKMIYVKNGVLYLKQHGA